MANLSQQKRQRMLEFIDKIREEHKDDDEMLIALGEIENELNSKKYGLVWEQHEEAVDVMMKDNIPVFTECLDKEIVADDSDNFNFLLEGDNLHSLKLLEKTHAGKVDVIYIDPPYNTSNKEFIYDDSMIGVEDGFRHSKWLSFISERLGVAKRLLSERGYIFISIDDNEEAQLKLLCNEIFGENNYVSTLHWKRKKQPSYLHGQVASVMEYILIYSKNRNKIDKLSISSPTDSNMRVDNGTNQLTERVIKSGIRVKLPETVKIIKKGIYKNKTMSTEFLDDVFIESGVTVNEFVARARFRDSQERIDKFCDEGVLFITKNYGFRRDKLKEELDKKKAITDLILDWGDNQDSDNEIKQIFGDKVFSYPKPTTLIYNLLKSTGYSNSIVLDFFAGSGTTAHAVLKLNQEDGGNRKFILCTNNENNICEEITYERIKRVINGYGDVEGIPANLKYYRTDFVSKDAEDVSDELLKHIKEMIQLEHGIQVDGSNYLILLTDEDTDELELKWDEYSEIKALYVSRNVLFTSKQNALFANVEVHIIPDDYFKFELQEVGEAW